MIYNNRFSNENNFIMVKGFNVNLKEVTRAISSISFVTSAITISQKIDGINYLCSYVTTSKPITKEYIRERLISIVPYYMIPAYIIFLDSMPMDSNGIIQKKYLPSPVDFDIIKNEDEFALPEKEMDIASLKDYDKIIKNNQIQNIHDVKKTPIGDILLTGACEFLGAHILAEFIKKEKGIAYCLVKDKEEISAKQRLINSLHLYFDNSFDIDIDTRIRVVRGIEHEYEFGLTEEEYEALGNQINSVIHCSELDMENNSYEEYKLENVKGTQKILDLCETYNLKLFYISTLDIFENKTNTFSESTFYIGQLLENPYVKSKFEAEDIVLSSIKKGLNAYIIRLDNKIRKTYPENILKLANYYDKKYNVFHLQENQSEYSFTKKFLEKFS